MRHGVTQQLALDARDKGYDGIAYQSAQQHGADCYVVFGSALRSSRRLSSAPLAKADTLHAPLLRRSVVPACH